MYVEADNSVDAVIAVHGEQVGLEARGHLEEDPRSRAETPVGGEKTHQGQEQLQAERRAEEGPTCERTTPSAKCRVFSVLLPSTHCSSRFMAQASIFANNSPTAFVCCRSLTEFFVQCLLTKRQATNKALAASRICINILATTSLCIPSS